MKNILQLIPLMALKLNALLNWQDALQRRKLLKNFTLTKKNFKIKEYKKNYINKKKYLAFLMKK